MEDSLKVIVFRLREQRYCANIQQVVSIERLQHVTEVPKTSDFIKGIINLHGEIIPIIDLKERLQLEDTNRKVDEPKILIVSIDTVKVGLIVDAATDVIDIDPQAIEAAPKLIGGVKEAYLHGVAKLDSELLLLLDLERVLNIDEIKEVQQVIEE
ncbi:chemotaxis protein CheW [Virgibacillus sp. FSP13]